MDFGSLAVLFAKAAASGVVSRISHGTTDTILDWFKNEAKRSSIPLTKDELVLLNNLLRDDASFFNAITANFLWKRNGLVIAGPSGSGKSTIFNYVCNQELGPTSVSTFNTYKDEMRFGWWRYTVMDTPGQIETFDLGEKAFAAIKDGRERILLLVFGAGFLRTAGIVENLKRPVRSADKTFVKYLANSIAEETNWVKHAVHEVTITRPRRRFTHLMVIVNKMDQWYERADQVVQFFEGSSRKGNDSQDHHPLSAQLTLPRGKEFRKLLATLTKKWCIAGVRPTFHYVSSLYNSVYSNAPSGKMSVEASETSMLLLRALIRLRMLES